MENHDPTNIILYLKNKKIEWKETRQAKPKVQTNKKLHKKIDKIVTQTKMVYIRLGSTHLHLYIQPNTIHNYKRTNATNTNLKKEKKKKHILLNLQTFYSTCPNNYLEVTSILLVLMTT